MEESNIRNDKTLDKGEKDMFATIETHQCNPVYESLKESLKEVKLMRKGSIPKKDWREMLEEMEKDNER